MNEARAARALRVVHVDTERGWRGGERQALWLAGGLVAAGHSSVVASRPGEPLFARAASRGLDTVACAPRFEADPLAAMRLRRLLQRVDADVVHAHTAHAAGLAALAALGTRTRLVIARRVDFRLRANAGTRWKYARAAAVIAVSGAVAEIVLAGGVAARKLHVVPDATDVSRKVVPANAVVLQGLGVRPAAPLVVQVAQLVGHKDPLSFVHAMAQVRQRVPDVQALMVGDGPLRPAVAAEIERLGLTDAVHLAGYRTDADQLLASADVATLSSCEEGMGSVLLDASLFGLAIAATDAGGIPEVVLDGRTGLIAPRENSRALGEAITRLLLDRPLARRLAAAARERAPEFSVERMVERTVAVYRTILPAD